MHTRDMVRPAYRNGFRFWILNYHNILLIAKMRHEVSLVLLCCVGSVGYLHRCGGARYTARDTCGLRRAELEKGHHSGELRLLLIPQLFSRAVIRACQ